MSKFHKTSYGRSHNFNAVSSSHSKRIPVHEQVLHNWGQTHKQEFPLEKKIEIEPTHLFTQKNYQRTAVKTGELEGRHSVNRSEAKFYETSIGFTHARERPQSKQEPRPKGKGDGKIKTEVFLPDRPQTSKGVRSFRPNEVKERQISENDEEFPIQIRVSDKKRGVQSGYSRKSTNQSNIMAFETSIDPEFLSLFANWLILLLYPNLYYWIRKRGPKVGERDCWLVDCGSIKAAEVGVKEFRHKEPTVDDETGSQVSGSPDEGRGVEADEFVGESTRHCHADRSVHEISQGQNVFLFEIRDVVGPALIPAAPLLFLFTGPVPPLSLDSFLFTTWVLKFS